MAGVAVEAKEVSAIEGCTLRHAPAAVAALV